MKLSDEQLLSDRLLAASFLPAGHLDRATARAEAYGAGPEVGAAFDRACEAQDTVQFSAHEVVPPAGLAARLMLVPTMVMGQGGQSDSASESGVSSVPDEIGDSVSTLTDRLLAFPDAGIAPARRVAVSRRLVAAVFFAALTGGIAAWQVGLVDWAMQPSVRARVADVASAAAVVNPVSASVRLPATQPAVAINLLREHNMSGDGCQAEDLPILVLEPVPGYALQSVGVTQLAGHPARFATYVHEDKQYTLYQLSTADLGLPTEFDPYSVSAKGNHIKVWPSVTNACTWVLVSAHPVSIDTSHSGY